MNAIYKKNIACAQQYKPQIVDLMKNASLITTFEFDLAIMPTKQPVEQANYILEQEYLQKKESIDRHIFGLVFCLDYFLLQGLFRRYTWYTRLFVIFPSADFFFTLLHRHDFTVLIKDPKFMPLAFNDLSLIEASLKHNLNQFDFYTTGLQFFEYQPFRALFPETVEVVSKYAKDVTLLSAANVNTLLIYGYGIMVNNVRNLNHFLRYPDVSVLDNVWEGKPIVCVSAGPSLSKNIAFLKKIQNDVYIIAMTAVLRPLLAAGIKPDMITMVDMSEQVMRYLEGIDTSDMYSVIELGCFHEIVDKYPAKYIFSMSAIRTSQFMNDLVGKLNMNINEKFILPGSLTVATLSILLAKVMGASKIILLGHDLAYSDKTHVKGSRFSHPTKIIEVNGRRTFENKLYDGEVLEYSELVPVKGFWGDQVDSTYSFITFREYIEKVIKTFGMDVVNATEGGSYIEGTEHITLKEAYQRYIKPHIATTKALQIPSLRQDYNYHELPDVITHVEDMIALYESMNAQAVDMMALVEQNQNETTTPEQAKAYDQLITEFVSKYEEDMNKIGQIGHPGQFLFRHIINSNTSKHSDVDTYADARNKLVLMSSTVLECTGVFTDELKGLVTKLKDLYDELGQN